MYLITFSAFRAKKYKNRSIRRVLCHLADLSSLLILSSVCAKFRNVAFSVPITVHIPIQVEAPNLLVNP
jgi:hypothetical protein